MHPCCSQLTSGAWKRPWKGLKGVARGKKRKWRKKKELIFFLYAKPKTNMPSCRVWSPYGQSIAVMMRGNLILMRVAASARKYPVAP